MRDRAAHAIKNTGITSSKQSNFQLLSAPANLRGHPMMRDLSEPFPCPIIDETGLADLGISMRQPDGMSIWWRDNDGAIWKEVGRIRIWDNDVIEIHPYAGISHDEAAALAGAAWGSWFDGASDGPWWTHGQRGNHSYLECVINTETDSGDLVTRVIRASERRAVRQDRLLFGEAA